MTHYDAVIVGAGHHGLVAAIELAEQGWQVVVLEERDVVGGAVAHRQVGDFVMDEFSACHPLALASPVLKGLELERYGLQWARTDRVVAHLADPSDTHGDLLSADPAVTAEHLDAGHTGDGHQWRRLVEAYDSVKGPLLDALLLQWPPIRSLPALVRAVGGSQLLDFARFALLPVEQLSRERFGGSAARNLLSGNAMHADIPPDAPGSGIYGWIMTMLAQDVGFPSPRGGTGGLAQALAARAQASGVQIRTGDRVTRIETSGDRVQGVQTASGEALRARVVIADTSAPMLYGELLDDVPAGIRARMDRFTWDLPTVKLNLGLSAPMPWTAAAARGTGVVHVGGDHRELVTWSAELSAGRIPHHPFALIGQMTTIDPSRSPAGTEALWLYTHLPRGLEDEDAAAELIGRSEQMLDRFAPGWRDLVVERWDQTPRSLAQADANLGRGAVGGGTMQLFQQAMWRPVTGLGGPRTYVRGLYLGSAAIHPGGGVHGGAGHMAAHAALRDRGVVGRGAGLVGRRLRRIIDNTTPRF
ncbi:phytoene desaturase family protein [Calidifontibacter indicus]|uniref:Pyridine nucleotide-disulfide oxidoreductase domain-containing protein 2 n=1 Tax=Calidifontibacter indicus TaxID=419650 RepID=A0A3D9UXZ1_9MICO|nr:NAD(P)/FAD-dependent oxidoreductase [Calidifontibacter indicus]REF30844.1 phytoene dehydrogenase-like protein [Calidifontibacter indicus]